ncbi:MAG: hypothetical protein ACREV9_04690 [Burkholderiales bacterium]
MRKRNVALISSAAVALASAGIAWVLGKRKSSRTSPLEIAPLPENRAFDREENIEYLRHNYPEREYQHPSPAAPQPDSAQERIEKDAPLRGFHGG